MKNSGAIGALTLSLIILTQAFVPKSFANSEQDRRAGIGVVPAFVGVIFLSTASANTRQGSNGVAFVGLLLVATGVATTSAEPSSDSLNNEKTTVQGYDGAPKPGEAPSFKVSLQKALEAVEMESLLVSEDSSTTNQSLVLNEFAHTVGLEPARMADLIVKSKSFADGKLDSQKFASQKVTVSREAVSKLFAHELSEVEQKVVTNYLSLRNIQIEGRN